MNSIKSSTDSNNNRLLGNRYRIVKILGKGGMSIVYLAENIKLGTSWAIKEISKNSDIVKTLTAESDILKKLNHPALPRIVDVIETEDKIYIVQDFIEGISLDKYVENSGRLPEEKVVKWGLQICDVLTYLHHFKPHAIIYRDMKPANIILTPWGDIKLVDFGIAREFKESLKNDTVYIGTRGYAAPEQYGGGQSGVTTDIYSFGVTIFHLLTGESPNRFPFGLKLPEYYNADISHRMLQIISKCTRYNPEERYQSAHEIKRDLEGLEKKINKTDIALTNLVSSNRRAILTVWGNGEFASELAYVISKVTNLNVLLADLDLLSPDIDIYLNIKKYVDRITKERILNESGINIVLDSIEKGSFTREELLRSSIKRKELKNLYILTGNYRLENYEYYSNDGMVKFIEKAGQLFDIVILTVNKSIYDSFTVLCLLKSHLNIVPLSANIDRLREFNNYVVFLEEKQQIPLDKTKFVAFDYHPQWNLDRVALKEITQDNYLGKIGHCAKREKYRNLDISYAKRMEPSIVKDYISILQKLQILKKGVNIKGIKKNKFALKGES